MRPNRESERETLPVESNPTKTSTTRPMTALTRLHQPKFPYTLDYIIKYDISIIGIITL